MIWQSHFWRRELKFLTSEIAIWSDELGLNGDDDEATFRLERCLFLSAFAIRKLIDSEKVPDPVASSMLSCRTFPAREKVSHRLCTASLIESYDLDSPEDVQLPLRQACNELIHSRYLANCFSNDGVLTSIFVVSDRNVDSRLVDIPAEEWLSAMTLVSKKSVKSIHKWLDENSGRVITKLG